MRVASLLPILLLAPLISWAAGGEEYRSVSVDPAGRLHIVLDSEKEILPPKAAGQVSFGSPAISPDRRTAGWLEMHADPNVTYYKGAEIAAKLVIFRAGRVLHSFATEQTIWDWQFRDGGKRVAYSTGPTHGGAVECVLRDVDSGRRVSVWQVRDGSEPPEWARTLRR